MELVMLVSTKNLLAEDGFSYFYVPLFANSSHLLDSPLIPYYSFFLALELFLIFFSSIINAALIFALSSSSLIHTNLKYIWLAHLCEYFIFAVAQIILVCYQVGIYKTTGSLHTDVWLVIAGLGKLHFMWGTLLVLTATVIERAIATKYINKYETLRNRKIAISFGAIKSLLSFTISSLIVCVILRYTPASILVVIVLSTTLLLYFALRTYNSRMLSTMVNVYTLSSKYQVTENIRILTLLRNVFVLVALSGTVVVSLMGILRSMEYADYLPFAAVMIDMIIAGFPVEVILVAAWHFRDRGRTTRADGSVDEHARESLIYFKQLNNSWSKRNQKIVFKK